MLIIPSLVEQTPDELFEVVHRLSSHYNHFQIDIEDGIFVPYKTLSVLDFAKYIQTNSKKSTHFIYDFHLMENNHMSSIDILTQISSHISIDVIFVHFSFRPDMALLSKTYPQFKFGLVINPSENIQALINAYKLNSLSLIQLMTVNPGAQGQSFIKESLNKIEQLRKGGFVGKIYIDGAINTHSIPLIKQLVVPPDVLCPGSFLAKTDSLEEHISYLKKEVAG